MFLAWLCCYCVNLLLRCIHLLQPAAGFDRDVDASLPVLEHVESQSGGWRELRAKVKQGNHLQVREGRSESPEWEWDFPKREQQKVRYSGNCQGMFGLAE
jgi:hypothetical protein